MYVGFVYIAWTVEGYIEDCWLSLKWLWPGDVKLS